MHLERPDAATFGKIVSGPGLDSGDDAGADTSSNRRMNPYIKAGLLTFATGGALYGMVDLFRRFPGIMGCVVVGAVIAAFVYLFWLDLLGEL